MGGAVAYAETGARRLVVGIAYVPPKVVELLRAALGADVDLVDATRIRTASSRGLDLALVGQGPDWRLLDRLAAAGCPVVVLADTRNESAEYKAIEHGASGYLVMATPPATLRRALRAALAGEPVFRRSVLGRWLRAQVGGPRERPEAHAGLTPRQQQILGLIAQGATTKEIAGRLRIKNSTVDKHISHLLKRVGVPNRAAAVGALGWSAVQSGASRPKAPAFEEDHEAERELQPTSVG
jgi:DNA-binding NarL/FixJ family response regulator